MAGVFFTSGSLRAKVSCAKIVTIILVTLGVASATNTDLWKNPCSNHPVRHVRSTAEKELNFFITTLNKDMFRELKNLYPKNLKKVRGKCPPYHKLIGPVRTAVNVTVAHQRFHLSMLEFAAFLDKLKDIPVSTSTDFAFEKRKEIYEKTKDTLRLTICEFNETILNEFNLQPLTNSVKGRTTRCLPDKADLSRMQMLDMQFFKKLKKFFTQGKKILKRRKKNSESSGRLSSSGGSVRTKH
ncbi:hypothetical protein ABEB36_000340 [Hypothenemus hampei]|uniref:Uncharacterized protein n=1 Tax=Hypothenemus hampei TaxID=57062 RepID=A0ABD1FBF3_HYPHA